MISQPIDLRVWLNKGCGGQYVTGETITVYWDVSHPCDITIWGITEEPAKITSEKGEHSQLFTAGSELGEKTLHVEAVASLGSNSAECTYYVVEEDSDNDGVYDSEDVCSNPGCEHVDDTGCPVDTDQDGLTDCDDLCPHESGISANKGCPLFDVFSSTRTKLTSLENALIGLCAVAFTVIVLFVLEIRRSGKLTGGEP